MWWAHDTLRNYNMKQTWYKGGLFEGREGSEGLEKGQRQAVGNRAVGAEKRGQRRTEGGRHRDRPQWRKETQKQRQRHTQI